LLELLALCTGATSALAQGSGRIVGRVTTADGARPLPSATVVLVGAARGAVTDADGRFTIADVAPGAHRVQARRLGYVNATQSVTVSAALAATANFALVTSPVTLEEIKTVGYGTQDVRTVTGAVATVTADKVKDIPTYDPVKAIQGRIPGVEVVQSNNEPGSPYQVRIRGVRSLSASNEPLYVIDGIPISGGIQDFNPAIIASYDVLKDAAATAIYGSRGANGVILITTKKGIQDGKMHSQYTFDSYAGRQNPVKVLNMMNMQQYTRMLQDGAFYNGGALNGDTTLAKVLAGQSFVGGIPKRLYAFNNNLQTDWFNTVLQDSHQNSFQGSLMGSSPDTRYTASGNYFDQGGLIPGQGYRRGSGFASVDHDAGRLHVGVSTNIGRIYQDIGESGGAFGYTAAMQPYGRPLNYTNPDLHLVYGSQYDNSASGVGIPRDLNDGRPFRRLKPTQYELSLWNTRYLGTTPGSTDVVDTRFDGSFQSVWIATSGGLKNPFGAPASGPSGVCPTNNLPQAGLLACTSNATVNANDTTIMYATYPVDSVRRRASKYTIRTTCPAGMADPSVYCGDNFGENNGYIGWDRYPVLKKFQDNLRTGGFNDQNGGKVQVVYRLGEVYLIAAEADVALGNTAEAASFINVLRTRAASPAHKADPAFQVTAAQMNLDFIMDERERELAGEFQRWYDVTRPGVNFFLARVKKYNSKAAPNLVAKHILRPIPQTQIDGVVVGPKYPQNPGY
jgi:TonB-dependent SusC/RagA subfamily outer membrane receptor